MTTNSPSVTTNSPSGQRFCEVCGDPADHLSAEGWCACLEHLASPKPTKRIFWFRTGERLDETGVPPSKRPLNRWNYERPFCEVCGADPGPYYSVEGWSTCDDHFRAPKPARPLFDARTGIRLGPYDDLGPHEVPPGARGNRRGEPTFCEICGAAAGSVRDGSIVCHKHFHEDPASDVASQQHQADDPHAG